MTATDETLVLRRAEAPQALSRAEGIELLGNVHGSGYEGGSALVRRADGQVVQLGPLLYALLENLDGRRSTVEVVQVDFSESHKFAIAGLHCATLELVRDQSG